jgi:hypothetical protein
MVCSEYTFTIVAKLSEYCHNTCQRNQTSFLLRYFFYSVLCLAANLVADKLAYSKLELVFESYIDAITVSLFPSSDSLFMILYISR